MDESGHARTCRAVNLLFCCKGKQLPKPAQAATRSKCDALFYWAGVNNVFLLTGLNTSLVLDVFNVSNNQTFKLWKFESLKTLSTGFVLTGPNTGFVLTGVNTGFVLTCLNTSFVLTALNTGFVLSGLRQVFVLTGLNTGLVFSPLNTVFVSTGFNTCFVLTALITGFVLAEENTVLMSACLKTAVVLNDFKLSNFQNLKVWEFENAQHRFRVGGGAQTGFGVDGPQHKLCVDGLNTVFVLTRVLAIFGLSNVEELKVWNAQHRLRVAGAQHRFCVDVAQRRFCVAWAQHRFSVDGAQHKCCVVRLQSFKLSSSEREQHLSLKHIFNFWKFESLECWEFEGIQHKTCVASVEGVDFWLKISMLKPLLGLSELLSCSSRTDWGRGLMAPVIAIQPDWDNLRQEACS